MKQIFTVASAALLTAGLALTATTASAEDRITYTQNGVTWSTSKNVSVFASQTRDRALSEHRHGGHFGSPTHGSYGRDGTYNKPIFDALNANNRRSITRVDVSD